MIIVTHSSNVTGEIYPIAEIGKLAHEHGILMMSDIAQSAGHLLIDMEKMNLDILCFSGHKGLLGNSGVGGFCLAQSIEIEPLISGGTGMDSFNHFQSDYYPEHVEAGTRNMTGIASLKAGVFYLMKYQDEKSKYTNELVELLYDGLKNIPQVVLYGDFKERTPILAFNIRGMDSFQVADLLNNKYDIDLILLQKKGEFLKDIPKNVNVTEIRKNNFQYVFFRFVSPYRKYIINKIINKKKYDVAIGFFEGRSATWVADIKQKIRKIAWIHNDVNKFNIGISEKEIIDTYNKMDKVITVSEVAKASFCDKYKFDEEKVEVLYNLIDEKNIIEKSKEEVKKNNVFTFTNVGKMRPQKRQDRLIKIAKNLKNDNYKFKIQIIGNGPEEEKIKKLIKDYDVEDVVELLGLKLNPYPYIKQADCIVVSSDFEGYSVAIKEALLLKKAIVSTNVSGVSEMFENGKYGIATEISTEALEKTMKMILDGTINIKKIEANLEKFDCGNNQIIRKLINLIEG